MIKKSYVSIILLLLILTSYLTDAQNSAQWRGENRNGIYSKENNLLKIWPETGPEILWHAEGLGDGYASVVVSSDMIFSTGSVENKGYVFAFDKLGKQVWKKEYGEEWTDSYPGTRTTPTYFEGKVIIHSSLGLAACFDAKTGNKIWSEDLNQKYKVRLPRWGISESPLIIDEKVIFTPGGEEIVMIAKNINTGETIWESKLNGEKSAYNSPLFVKHNGIQMIITNLEKSVVAVAPENGKMIWEYPQINKYAVHPNTPIYKDGMIYSITGYGVGSIMLKLSENGKSVENLWSCITHDNQMGGAIWLNDNIYASGHKNRQWQCVDAKTGSVKFENKDISKGNIIFADGMLYIYGDRGEIGLLKPTDLGFEIVSKFDVVEGSGQHWAHLVISDGVLYCRHGDAVIAYDIRQKE